MPQCNQWSEPSSRADSLARHKAFSCSVGKSKDGKFVSCLQKSVDKRVFSSDEPSFKTLDDEALLTYREPVQNTTSGFLKTSQHINCEA